MEQPEVDPNQFVKLSSTTLKQFWRHLTDETASHSPSNPSLGLPCLVNALLLISECPANVEKLTQERLFPSLMKTFDKLFK